VGAKSLLRDLYRSTPIKGNAITPVVGSGVAKTTTAGPMVLSNVPEASTSTGDAKHETPGSQFVTETVPREKVFQIAESRRGEVGRSTPIIKESDVSEAGTPIALILPDKCRSRKPHLEV
jgi:hypothetical protein